jgi:hypothetical protein
MVRSWLPLAALSPLWLAACASAPGVGPALDREVKRITAENPGAVVAVAYNYI